MKTYAELFELCMQSQYDAIKAPILDEIIHDPYEKVTVFMEDTTMFVVYPQTIGAFPSKGWELNLKFWKKDYREDNKKIFLPFYSNTHTEVHSGFLDAFMANRDKLDQDILHFNPKKIVIIGYSQGSAIATLSFMDLLTKQGKALLPKVPVHCVAFASPRVFNRFGATMFNILCAMRSDCTFLRILNYKDLVTRVAPWFFGFRHVMPRKANRMVLGGPNNRQSWIWGSTPLAHYPDPYRAVLKTLTQGIE